MSENPLVDEFSGNWRDYVDVYGFNEKDTQRIERTLDMMTAKVPEFCDLLRSTQAPYATHFQDGTEKPTSKVEIMPPYPYDVGYSPLTMKDRSHNSAIANSKSRLVKLDPSLIDNIYYKDKSGNNQSFSLQSIIFHEFIHIADPAVINFRERVKEFQEEIESKYQLINKIVDKTPEFLGLRAEWENFKSDRLEEKIRKAKVEEIEEYTVQRTNAVMHRHFGEEPRDGYNSGSRWLKILFTKGSDPLIHENTQHEQSFIPLPIVDVIDPKRMELATELARTIHEKIDQASSMSSDSSLSVVKNAEVSSSKRHINTR